MGAQLQRERLLEENLSPGQDAPKSTNDRNSREYEK